MFRRAHISENNNILFAPHSVLSLHLINPSTVGSGLSHPTAHIHIGRAPITEPYRPRNCQRVTSGLCHASPPYFLGPPSDNTMTVSRAVREKPLTACALPPAHVTATSRPRQFDSAPCQHPRPPALRHVRHLCNPRGPLTGCHVTR
jgi:hypothetical protein